MYEKTLLSEIDAEVIELILQKTGFRPYEPQTWVFGKGPTKQYASIRSTVLPIDQVHPFDRVFAPSYCQSALYYSYILDDPATVPKKDERLMQVSYYNLFTHLSDSLERLGTLVEIEGNKRDPFWKRTY